jgi:tellurite resistance protein
MTAPPLKFLMPGWFSLVMGLSGPARGEMATGAALVLSGLALLVFVVLAAASLLRWQRYPQALEEDLKHPMRHGFVATVPVSLLLLATAGHALGLTGALVQAIWWAGSLLQLWATLWVLGRWLAPMPNAGTSAQAGALWPGVTPVLFIPVVGNVVAPLAGVGLGHDWWCAAQLGIGVFFWPVVLVLALTRRLAHSPIPERMLPTWFITIAPPAVIGLALLQFQAPAWMVQGVWGIALFSLLWVGAQGKRMVGQPFGLPFWALSFPLAAFTSLTLKVGATFNIGALQTLGVLMLAITSLVVVGLALATVRGLRNGTLLAPEPVANIIPAS